MEIKLYNTLTNKKQEFRPMKDGFVSMYHCGPTLYGKQHIGNLSMFIFTDILRRAIEYKGFKVKQVINFTDFGHLSGDNEGKADEGEDKMTKGLKREGLDLTLANMKVLAEKYAKFFLNDLSLLNINTKNTIFPYASDYVKEQIEMVEKLLEKGFAYEGKEGVYFDTSKFSDYGKLGDIKLENLEEGKRVSKTEKKNRNDFVLWKKDKNIGWHSSFGLGFPGWHIECSAMIIKILGEQIDIHTGGIEHIGVHHNNEIAQSESYTGKKPFSNFWLHREHLKIDGAKISKSEGIVFYLEDLIKRKLHPLSFRFWLLGSHYKTPANFTIETIENSQNTYEKIISSFPYLPNSNKEDKNLLEKFEDAIFDDLNTPRALAVLQESRSKNLIKKIDSVLGLNIEKMSEKIFNDIPEEILELKIERDDARKKKEWQKSDDLRREIENLGFVLEDRDQDSIIRKSLSCLTEEESKTQKRV